MRHIKKCDVPELLPFALSCLKKLKATGLEHISQTFDAGIGQVRVELCGQHEYVWIDGGAAGVKMDSGVIDLGVITPTDPARYLPGKNYKSTLVTTYDAPFTIPSLKEDEVYVAAGILPGDAPSLARTTPWFTKPTPTGQVSGDIHVNREVIGYVRNDGVAKSFEPQRVSNNAVPPVKAPLAEDDVLVAKKKAALLCPPSMFTGRARLYAQALFGQHLYSKGNVSNDPPTLMLSYPYPPALRLSLHKDSNTGRATAFSEANSLRMESLRHSGILFPMDEYDVTLTVSSGVYLDTATGKHWLMNPWASELKVYELVGNPAAQTLRKWLTPAYADKLSAVDRGHLEAYILACSRPLVETRQVIPLGRSVTPYSMGYGWHWNWSGTTAAMVVNGTYPQSGVNFGMESTRYQLSVTHATEGGVTSFSAATSIAEGPTRWSVYRKSWCITHPNWINRQTNPDGPVTYWTEKTTVHKSEFTAAAGFFYAFYREDALQVCRVVTSVVEDVPEFDATSSPYYWAEGTGYLRSTNGMEDGYHEHTSAIPDYKKCVFSVGGAVSDAVTYGHTEGGRLERIHSKVDTGYGTADWSFSLTWGYGHHLEYGDGLEDGTWSYVLENGFLGFVRPHVTHMTYTQGDFAKEWYESAAVAIPHYDAEAVYTRTYSRKDTRHIDRENRYWTGTFTSSQCVTTNPPYTINPDGSLTYLPRFPTSEIYKKTFSQYPGWWTTTWAPTDYSPDETVTDETVSEKIHHRAGVTDAVSPGALQALGDIFSADDDSLDYFMGEFPARTSADFTTPVVLSLSANTGTTKADGNLVIVGWA